jgi:hypothetical protein
MIASISKDSKGDVQDIKYYDPADNGGEEETDGPSFLERMEARRLESERGSASTS